jgi:alpha-tubulin suppressor-like RCC1 family protein
MNILRRGFYGLPNKIIINAACGNNHAAVVLEDGTLWTAGDNTYGQLCRVVESGRATATNFGRVPGVANAKVAACGHSNTAVILGDGTLWTAGDNTHGQLCRNIALESATSVNFGQVPGVASAKIVSCGANHIAVILEDGTLWTAGNNSAGQLCGNIANGSATATNFGQVPGVTNAKAAACGYMFTAVILGDGTLWTAGYNNYGQICRSVANGSATATNFGQVPGVANAKATACGDYSTLVILGDGTLWTAGRNTYGELCRNVSQGSATATNFGQVPNITNAIDTASGEHNVVVILDDGTLRTAGNNISGQLCRNIASGSATATNFGQVPGVTNTKAAAFGKGFTAVVLGDGTFWTAGNNAYGQLCRNISQGSPTSINFGQVSL